MFSSGIRFLFFVLVIPVTALEAQNLVPNGSFEDFRVCPGSYTRDPIEFRADAWRPLTLGTPDYFNACSKGEAGVPYNWAGVSDAYDGHGYAGLYTWMSVKDFREYLHCKLTEPLVKDSVYQIAFRYKLSSYSKYCIDRIGVLLSDSIVPLRNDRPLRITPSIEFVKDSALTLETGSWELASAEYRAKGNEQFITIGNFSGDATRYYYIRFRPAQEPMLADAAYYYIDDVKVVPRFSRPTTLEPLPVFTGRDPELNTTYVLKNIQFEFNSYALLPGSYYDLGNVVRYLEEHPGVSVVLSGHTDDVGDAAYNETLSANRARSAAAYLIGKGIRAERITTRGYGESKPLIPETTDEARAVNRRVEITFLR